MTPVRLEISIDRQELTLLAGETVLQRWPVSTAAKGVGFDEGSYRTPTGRFRICEKIGDGVPADTIFRGRKPHGLWKGGHDDCDLILSRILRLEGLDPENRNSFDRYIYIHGTNQEEQIGAPASCGCVRLKRRDMIDLFDRVDCGAEVVIHPPTRPRGKLIFFDCDSTLSSIEGIDELARAAGPEVFEQVESLTHSAMNGEIPLDEVFRRRMECLAPDRGLCEQVARRYVETLTPGSVELLDALREEQWTPVILSGGFAPLIEPLATRLGIRHVEAVPMFHDDEGRYTGYGEDYPTTRNGGKPEIIRTWKQACLPERVVMIGDGISDLESREACDLFIGYGGVIERARVKQDADLWITDFRQLTPQMIESVLGASS
ncbi:HAD-IB family phosphatase [Haloferula sp. A504]|uniref:HAD-IB family phosphatase n=1 Tax=Haloferula sp. A504 TaxID=3373601 RepID=UPI0031C57F1B|nr:HAD-IB family phosphatase [Verrucomicrobiaceae bacterium E54]